MSATVSATPFVVFVQEKYATNTLPSLPVEGPGFSVPGSSFFGSSLSVVQDAQAVSDTIAIIIDKIWSFISCIL